MAEKARKAAIDANNEIIEKQNKNQEQIEKNKELYSSIEEVNKKYKAGAISRD
jgi:hypothetical protein